MTPHPALTTPRLRSIVLTLATLAGCAALASTALAEPVGTVVAITGPLLAHQASGSVKALALNSSVESGDLLETGANAFVQIKFIDNSELSLRPDTQFRIDAFAFNVDKPDADIEEFTLIAGGFHSVTGALGQRNHDKVMVHTPFNTIGIRGTGFGALLCQSNCSSTPTTSGLTPTNGLYVDVTQGSIVVANTAGQQVYQAGQFGYIANLNQPPIVLPPSQGVPVTMPTSISQNAPGTMQAPSSGSVDCIVR